MFWKQGSLAGVLNDSSKNLVDLEWRDPLLKFATDIARGMSYLHGRSFWDESASKRRTCIMHRDLKVGSF